MDNVTHALAGCLMGAGTLAAITRRGTPITPAIRRTTIAVGVVAAEFPDIDLVYSGEVLGIGKLGYMLHHRGHTHTVLFALVSALAIWGVARLLSRESRHTNVSRPLLWLALAGTLSHIVLDWTNNYGVHPWWPADNRWFYGDAMFIVEPWLWVASLPPLYFLATGRVTRALFVLAAVAIVAASWLLGQVASSAAAIVTIGLGTWVLANARASDTARLWLAGLAWVVVEGAFFATTRAARHEVERVAGPALVDVVVTPSPGDPFCLRALVVTRDGAEYVVANAAITPYPGLRGAEDCTGTPRSAPLGGPDGRAPSDKIRWNARWRGDWQELRTLVATNCRAAAAMEYIRVPQWRPAPDGGIELFDARYGDGGFASVTIPPDPNPCPRFVPGWTPPREALLGP